MSSSFFTEKIVRQDTIDLGTEKSKLASADCCYALRAFIGNP
jgi:hypothetical protein